MLCIVSSKDILGVKKYTPSSPHTVFRVKTLCAEHSQALAGNSL
jgi:hypothetical protein